MNTPVVFFAFRRVDTTRHVLAALRTQTVRFPLIIAFSDGARHDEDAPHVEAVRALLRAIDWTEVQLVEREYNYGGPANLIQGISQVFESYERAVIVEDDVLPSPHFYEAMCKLLDHYQSASSIFSVGGYPSLLRDSLPNYPYDVILSPRFSVWGWATWSDRWKQVRDRLFNFKNPFSTPDDVPLRAGADLHTMACEAEHELRGFFWAGTALALLSLYHGWLHALTTGYLVNNIGLNTGQHARENVNMRTLTAFLAEHNAIADKVPERFPPVEPRSDVAAAVQCYVDAINHITTRRRGTLWLPRLRRWLNQLRKEYQNRGGA